MHRGRVLVPGRCQEYASQGDRLRRVDEVGVCEEAVVRDAVGTLEDLSVGLANHGLVEVLSEPLGQSEGGKCLVIEVKFEVDHSEEVALHGEEPVLELSLLGFLNRRLGPLHLGLLELVVEDAVVLDAGPLVHDLRGDEECRTAEQLPLILQI